MSDQHEDQDTIAARRTRRQARVKDLSWLAQWAVADARKALAEAREWRIKEEENEASFRGHERRMETTVQRWAREEADPDSAWTQQKRAEARAKAAEEEAKQLQERAALEKGAAAGMDRIEDAAAFTFEMLAVGLVPDPLVDWLRVAIQALDGDKEAITLIDLVTAREAVEMRLEEARKQQAASGQPTAIIGFPGPNGKLLEEPVLIDEITEQMMQRATVWEWRMMNDAWEREKQEEAAWEEQQPKQKQKKADEYDDSGDDSDSTAS